MLQLENWVPEEDENTAPKRGASTSARHPASFKPTIELPVPPGQTEVAVQLIKCMYQKTPGLSDVSHQQMLQLFILADRFGVPKVQEAVLDAFKAIPVNLLDWETALTLLDLPASCAEQEGFKPVCDMAVKRLLQKLGDLEEVTADAELQKQLLSLPHAALLQLLQHDDLRVTSETTVVYTIHQWFQQQTGSKAVKRKQLQQLMQQVRMQHLSQLFISTVLMSSYPYDISYTMAEYGIACMCADAEGLEALKEAKCEQLSRYQPGQRPRGQPASGSRCWNGSFRCQIYRPL